jgi:hypothetical protein
MLFWFRPMLEADVRTREFMTMGTTSTQSAGAITMRLHSRRWAPSAAVAVVAFGMAVPLTSTTLAVASPATSTTSHFSVVQQWGSPTTPTSQNKCTGPIGNALLNDYVYINDTGNGIQHQTINGAGDGWFTTTFTGTGDIKFYRPSRVNVTFDGQGNITNVVINGLPDMTVSAQLQEWFGFEANKQNAVGHGTINAHGTVTVGSALINSGTAVSFHNDAQSRWAVGADQSGPPTFSFSKVGC